MYGLVPRNGRRSRLGLSGTRRAVVSLGATRADRSSSNVITARAVSPVASVGISTIICRTPLSSIR